MQLKFGLARTLSLAATALTATLVFASTPSSGNISPTSSTTWTGAPVGTYTPAAAAPAPGPACLGPTPPAPPRAGISASFTNYESPAGIGDNSGEPSIGVNWNSGNIMTSAVLDTLRVSFNTAVSPATA